MRGNEIKPIFVGHNDIGYYEIAVAVRDPTPQSCSISRCPNVVTRPPEGLRDHGSNSLIVIGNKNGFTTHGFAPPDMIGSIT